MRIFIPREVKAQEARVALTPKAVARLVTEGHHLLLQEGAGEGAGFADEDYLHALHADQQRLELVQTLAQGYGQAQLVVKVKEPQAEELELLKEGQLLFSYLHLAASRSLTQDLLSRKVVALSFETLIGSDGGFPLLEPMSRIAGMVGIQLASQLLQRDIMYSHRSTRRWAAEGARRLKEIKRAINILERRINLACGSVTAQT